MKKKVVIIGGAAGGAAALARLRRISEDVELVLLDKGAYVSYANCGLPYYIGNKVESRDDLIAQSPKMMAKRFNADVRVNSEVLEILANEKKIVVKDLKSNDTYQLDYDNLIISTGSTPLRPPISGIESSNIFSLWHIPDVDKIKAYVDNNDVKNAVVVGGGFIGLEMAENLSELGIKVSLVEMANQVMAPIDFEMAQFVHQHLKAKGVDLRLNDGVESFEHKDKQTTVNLSSKDSIVADMVILSIGIRPNGELAKNAGLAVNQRNGIIVNNKLQTSNADIYAIGDVVEVVDFYSKKQTMMPLAGPATKQARVAANNIFDKNETYNGAQGTSIAKVFDLSVANTGVNEKTLINNGKVLNQDYQVAIVQAMGSAKYYPNAASLSLKMIYDLKGKILGAQIVGGSGVDKRIDVLATAIRLNANITDLIDLDLAYAPPFNSVKDPVNKLGTVAQNQLEGFVEVVLPTQFKDLEKDFIKLCVLNDQELKMVGGCLKDSIHIPLLELRERLDELDKNTTYLTYCIGGVSGYNAARILANNGFKVKNLAGGLRFLNALNFK